MTAGTPTGRVGVVGLGAMGLPMAANLARAGIATFGCDVDAMARERAAGVPGLTLAESPGGMARSCDVVFTCLPSVEAVNAVYRGADGLIAAARPGLVTAECSTIDSEMARGLARAMREGGAAHLETLLIGRPPEAAEARLYFIVSGDAAALPRVTPLLRLMGRAWRHVGDNGAANTIKLLQNGLGYVYALATAEALALARERGADVDAFIDVVKEGGGIGWSKYFDLHAVGVAAGRDEGWGRLYIGAKDTEALRREIRAAALALPLLEAAADAYREAMAAGLAREEFTAISCLLERRHGRRFFGVAPGEPAKR